MTRISTLCVLSSTLIMPALYANVASAFTLVDRTITPSTKVNVQPKFNNNAVKTYRQPKPPAINKLPAVQ